MDASPGGPARSMSRAAARAVGAAARLALVAVVIAALGAVASPPASAESTLEAVSASGEHFVPGRAVALLVTVGSDSLLSGSVRVQLRDAQMGMPVPGPVEVAVEVAGGTEKEVVVVAPTSRWDRNGDQESRSQELTVELLDNGTVIAEDRVDLSARTWEETVGVLPDLAGLGEVPATAALKFRSGTAALIPVDPRLLGAGGSALGAFSTIAALPSDVAALEGTERTTLIEWLAAGGHLLVDAPSAPIEGLPDAWQPGPGGWSTAGSGDIRFTGGALQQRGWDDVLDPTEGGIVPSAQVNIPTVPGYTTAGGLGVDAGFKIPQLNALLIALSVYVLLVGPITFIVLGRMRRRPLAWLTIPALAGIFTALFAVTGAQLRNDTEAAHATVVEIGPTGARASTSTLVGSISGGTVALVHPEGWAINRPDTMNVGGPMMGASSTTEAISPALVARPGGAEATMNLDPGEFVLVESNGPAPMFDRAVEVAATATGTTITGTVRNNLAADLTEVVVLVGYSSTSIDRLGPGEERTFTVEDARSIADAPFPEYHHWTVPPSEIDDTDMMGMGMPAGPMVCGPNGCSSSSGFGNADPSVEAESDVNPSAWATYLGQRGDALRSLDTVSVVGWSDQVHSPLTTGDGKAIERGRTAIVARGPIAVSSLDSVGVRVQVAREVDFRKVDRNYDDAIVNGTLYRIVLPSEVGDQPVDPATVSIRFPAHLRSVLVWNTGGYTVVPEPDPGERIVYPLTPADVAAGVVYVRTRLQDQLTMPAGMQPPGLQGSGWGLNTGWEIFTGPIDAVHDSSKEAVDGGGGNNGGVFNGGGVAAPTTMVAGTIVEEPPPSTTIPAEIGATP